MKILHTADWHLGHKLFNLERESEQQAALDWLADYIIENEVELLLIAGDIFDTDSPPNYARKQYYSFLRRLVNSCCKHIVVVAGNHDSANMLEASGELLRLLNIYVVGNLPENADEQLVFIRDDKNNIVAIVAAVPFLRDRDVRMGLPGQTMEERVTALRDGIRAHYHKMGEAVLPYREADIPIIITGHLYVAGCERGDRLNTIHIGSLDLVDVSCFPAHFDYVALGHLHRPQRVVGKEHVRYSGSLIPLDFSEWNYAHGVTILEFEGRKLAKIESVPTQLKRRLLHYRAVREVLIEKLKKLEATEGLTTWLKLEMETESFDPAASEESFWPYLEGKDAKILQLTQIGLGQNLAQNKQYHTQNLAELNPVEVFEMRLDTAKIYDVTMREGLVQTFNELLSSMQERDKE